MNNNYKDIIRDRLHAACIYDYVYDVYKDIKWPAYIIVYGQEDYSETVFRGRYSSVFEKCYCRDLEHAVDFISNVDWHGPMNKLQIFVSNNFNEV